MGMAKYDRLLYILNMLRSRKNLNAKKIAEECRVTERSIYRDILSLSEANVPIYYDCGYKLASDNFLPPLNFDFDEYQFLKLALKSSPLNSNEKYSELASKLRAKIDAVIPKTVKEKQRFTTPTTEVDIPSTELSDKENVFLGLIEQAIENTIVLELKYDALESGLSRRKVEPYFVIFKGRAFYFVAYCQKKKDFRTFRINRVKSVGLTSERFIPKAGINAQSYFEGSWLVFSGELVKVVVKFKGMAARVIESGSHHTDEKIERIDDNELIYTAETRGLEEIKKWILGFGQDAEVLEPEELRASLKEIGEHLFKSYADDI